MKKLQNNFTTPEQSKRLLELGVPVWTADLYFYEEGCISNDDEPSGVIPYGEVYEDNSKEATFSSCLEMPCWSVGRLIEIMEICTQTKYKRVQQTDNLVYLSPIEDVLMQIEHNACGFFDNTKWDTNLLNG
jgi:hypothetical protein